MTLGARAILDSITSSSVASPSVCQRWFRRREGSDIFQGYSLGLIAMPPSHEALSSRQIEEKNQIGSSLRQGAEPNREPASGVTQMNPAWHTFQGFGLEPMTLTICHTQRQLLSDLWKPNP